VENATATVIVAALGIGGTLAASIIAGRMQRTTARDDRIRERRFAVYVDVLEVMGQFRENAQTWATFPDADVVEPSTDAIRSIDARIRVVGSDDVRAATDRVANLAQRFIADLFPARVLHERLRRQYKVVDTDETIKARMALGGLVDEMTVALKELESKIRAEMKV
jgi:hypothetical protein